MNGEHFWEDKTDWKAAAQQRGQHELFGMHKKLFNKILNKKTLLKAIPIKGGPAKFIARIESSTRP